MLNYIKLQLKLQFAKENGNKKGNITSFFISFTLFIVIIGLMYVLSDVLISSFKQIPVKDIAILFVFVIELMLTFVAISQQLKLIFKPFDSIITARFPMSNMQLYIASIQIVYLNLLINTLFSFLPIMIIFGIAANIISGAYVGLVIFASILAPIIPFSISLLVSVPIMFILGLLENRNIIRLLLFILLIIGFFFIYDYILNTLADYFIFKQIDHGTQDVWEIILSNLNSKFDPFYYVKELLFVDNIPLSLGIIALCSVLCGGIGLAISIPVFNFVHKRTLEGVKSAFSKKTKLTNDGIIGAMIKKEFKEILRTKVYAYFYLGVAIATPVMVFFCNRLVVTVGEAQLGTSIALGASVLVLSAFMTLINAFSGSAINKEAERFYITKLIPLEFKYQLLIKGLINFLVSMGALFISCFVVAELKFVSIEETIVLFTAEMVMAIAMIFTGFNLNLKYVKFNSRANGDVDESNVTIVMIIGLLISTVITVATIFICYFMPNRIAYIPIYLIPFICMVVNVIVFGTTAEKKYYRIEPR